MFELKKFAILMLATSFLSDPVHAESLGTKLPGNENMTIEDLLPQSITQSESFRIDFFDIVDETSFSLEASVKMENESDNDIPIQISNVPQQITAAKNQLQLLRDQIESLGSVATSLFDTDYGEYADCIGSPQEATSICLYGNVFVSLSVNHVGDAAGQYEKLKEIMLKMPVETLRSVK